LKPAEVTPLTALALAELAHRSGIPQGVLNIVVGDAKAIGERLIDFPAVKMRLYLVNVAVTQIQQVQPIFWIVFFG